MLAVVIATTAVIGFAFAAWWTGCGTSTPNEAEQMLAECEEDSGWSEQDEDDFTEYFGQFGEF